MATQNPQNTSKKEAPLEKPLKKGAVVPTTKEKVPTTSKPTKSILEILTPKKEGEGGLQEATSQSPKEKSPKKTVKRSSWIKPLRTYKSDISEVLKKGQASLTRIIIAEKQKQERAPQEDLGGEGRTKKVQRIAMGVFGVLILIGGALLLFFAFPQNKGDETSPSLILSENLIFMEEEKNILLTQKTTQELQQKMSREIESLSLPINEIERLNFIVKETRLHPETLQEVTREVKLGFAELFSILDSAIPSSLLRLLNQDFIFGLHSFTRNNPFFLLTTNSYANAFSGMLLWEKTMLRDLTPLFGIETSDTTIFSRQFEDAIIKNQDSRVVRDENNTIILMYSFINKNILIITNHEVTLDEVVERLRRPSRVLR